MVVYRGEKFSGYNKPKRTPKHPKKSHAVLAKKGDKIKLIRFGQQGVRGAGKTLSLRKIKPGRSRITLDIMLKIALLISYQLDTGVIK